MFGDHFPLGDLVLGVFFPSKTDKVVVLNSFVSEKVRVNIFKQSHKRIKLLGVLELMVTF
jgi:hypothetical protein